MMRKLKCPTCGESVDDTFSPITGYSCIWCGDYAFAPIVVKENTSERDADNMEREDNKEAA